MKTFFSILDKLMEWISFLSIGGFTALVFLQVVFRFVFKSPIHWQEEVCLYLLYLVVLSGAILAIRRGAHISVDFVSQRLNPHQQTLLKIVIYSFVLICCIFITYSGFLYCTSVGDRRSSELRIMMKYIYMMFPIAGILMSVYSLREVLDACRSYFKKGGED